MYKFVGKSSGALSDTGKLQRAQVNPEPVVMISSFFYVFFFLFWQSYERWRCNGDLFINEIYV